MSDSDILTLLGYTAALLTTGSFIPQAVLTLRTQDVSGISVSMYAAFTLGVALWLAYGCMLGQWPIIVANGVTLALSSTILVLTLRLRRRQ
jgi:MtN3 and saliva related transmembrane protein